jgi:hypothetical protein
MVSKEKIDNLYIMRDDHNTKGLIDLIYYLNKFGDTTNMRMVEIGSYAGESTEIFAKHFKEVIAIDPFSYIEDDLNAPFYNQTNIEWSSVYEKFLSNTENYKNINHIKKTSDDSISEIPNDYVDFVYIDGLHTYEQVKTDIKNYLPKIKKGGFIGGHDYHPNWQGVVDAVNEHFKIDKTFSDTSWIIKL